MDTLTLVGILVAVSAILVGQHLEGGHIETLINLPALIIVLGGTFGAVMVETPIHIMKRSMQILWWTFFPPKHDKQKTIEEVLFWSHVARKEGFLGLETLMYDLTNPLAQKGVQMLIDGSQAETIKDVLSVDVESKENRDLNAANVFESMGGYCPTIGILGAVLGLIQVLGSLGEPETLGSGIAVAFVATIYGVGFANLVFLPMANKMKNLVYERSHYDELIIEGLCAISRGENPRAIEARLQSYVENQ